MDMKKVNAGPQVFQTWIVLTVPYVVLMVVLMCVSLLKSKVRIYLSSITHIQNESLIQINTEFIILVLPKIMKYNNAVVFFAASSVKNPEFCDKISKTTGEKPRVPVKILKKYLS